MLAALRVLLVLRVLVMLVMLVMLVTLVMLVLRVLRVLKRWCRRRLRRVGLGILGPAWLGLWLELGVRGIVLAKQRDEGLEWVVRVVVAWCDGGVGLCPWVVASSRRERLLREGATAGGRAARPQLSSLRSSPPSPVSSTTCGRARR